MPKNMTPYNQFYDQTIRSGAAGVSVARSQIARYLITDVAAASTSNAMAAVNLGAQVQSVITGFTAPDYPRNVVIDGNVSGITGNVKVYGTDFEGAAINETIALNGTTDVAGALAFKTVTKVDLPVQVHTPAKQKATVEVTQGAQDAGSTVFTFVSAATGDAFDVSVAFLAGDDTPAEAATKLIAGLNANATFSAKWLAAAGSGANITIESKTFEAQDATINLTVKTAGASAITLGAIAVDTVAGVPYDKVSVGYGTKIGIPFLLTADEKVLVKLFDNSADSGTVTASATVLSANVLALNGTPNGAKDVELYILTP